MRRVLVILTLTFFSLSVYCQLPNSKKTLSDWEFVKGDLANVWEAFRPVKQSKLPNWTTVSAPHCYNAFDAVDPDVPYYQGPGWYRTFIEVDNPFENGRTVLYFEGAGQKTEIYLYTTKISEHVGGYDEFSVDLTEAISAYQANFPNSREIPIAVRCDNSRDAEMIPSDLSDFNLYGGLYRSVNLVYLPEVNISRVQSDYSLSNDLKKAEISIKAVLNTKNSHPTTFTIQLLNSANKEIKKLDVELETWNGIKEIANFSLKNPSLWHPDSPALYKLIISIDGKQSITKNIGFRKVEFIEKGPLHVNGERLLLRGTHRHEDHAGLGAAMSKELMRAEMLLMKEMGVNFIRLGHYQQSSYILDLCDSLGIFVWEEIPWCRGGLGGDLYQEQARRMLTNMITHHYNHPSVIIWGLGNENDWPGDFDEFDTLKIQEFMSELNDLAHSMDPKRKTAIRRCDFCKHIIDIYSPSIWAGWYRGKYINYKKVSYSEAMEVNHFLHVEWGASNHAGRHSENPDVGLDQIRSLGADERDGDFLMTGGSARVSKDGDWSETYACNLIDWHLKEQENMDWLTGTAYWPFKDFSTPLRPENPVPYVNQKGVVQRDLRKKEAFYVFQSYWTGEPMAHLYGHTWETRWGKKDEEKLIKVYSNCDKAEVFLNGKSLGTKERNSQDFPGAGLRWKTSFKEGQNTVKVVAEKGESIVVDEINFNYQIQNWGKPYALRLKELNRVGDTILLEARIYDEKGIFCPDAKNAVEFSITGDGYLLDNMGTWDGSRKIQLYNGRAMIKVKLTGRKAVLGVSSDNIETGFINIGIP